MADTTTFQEGADAALDAYKKVLPLAEAYRGDPEFRSRADDDPRSVLTERDFELPPGVEVRFAEDTDDVFHLVLPPDPNVALSDEALGMVAGGKSASTIGSAGSASTVSTICTTASCAASASSLGSAGSAS